MTPYELHNEAAASMSPRVAIFGGGFNPPHLAHLFTVYYLLSRADVDEVWLLPAVKHAFQKRLAPLGDRVSMLEDTLLLDTRVKLCLVEDEPEMSGRTYDTLSVLSARYPKVTFKLTIGSDNLTSADRWYRFDDLCARWQVIALGRPGHEEALRERAQLDWCLPGPTLMSVSSSEIRATLQAHHDDRLLSQTPVNWDEAPLIWIPTQIRERVYAHYAYASESEPITSLGDMDRSAVSEHMIWVWGRGRCGRALARGLERAGVRVCSTSLRSFFESTDAEQSVILRDATHASVWVFACRDDAISDLARDFASRLSVVGQSAPHPTPSGDQSASPPIALHCSGARSHHELDTLCQVGWDVGKMHPLMALRGDESDQHALGSAAYLITGSERAQEIAEWLVERLGGVALPPPSHPPELSPERRLTLYHIAAVFGANLASVPLVLGELIFVELGYTPTQAQRALRSLYRVALEPQLTPLESSLPSLKEYDALETWARHLTGPVVRGDVGTIAEHIHTLRAFATLKPESDKASSQNPSVASTHGLDDLDDLDNLYKMLSLMAARLLKRDEVIKALTRD